MSQCNSCHQTIVWAHHHETGKAMPLDLRDVGIDAPSAFVILGGDAYPRAAALEKVALDRGISTLRARELLADWAWRTSHFATCTDPEKYRRLR
jgi:hypothetical protein